MKKKTKHFPNNKQVTLTVNWKWSKDKKKKLNSRIFTILTPSLLKRFQVHSVYGLETVYIVKLANIQGRPKLHSHNVF